MDFERFFELRCSVQHYDWGQRARDGEAPFIADLLGTEAEPEQPYAELWIGAHPSAPAIVKHPNGTTPIGAFIAENPKPVLGEMLVDQQGAQLPFLLKVLSCEKPLSIQAHPERELAAELHERDPEHYKDTNHKPEIAVAISDFDLLTGFRPPEDIRAQLRERASLTAFFGPVLDIDPAANPKVWLQKGYGRIFSASETDVERALEGMAKELAALEELSLADKRFLATLEHYPGDRGALSAYFLNAIHLEPGQAVFTGAGIPHSYLNGTIVECMANSDNVVRAGLTPKFIDQDVLLRMLTYEYAPPPVLKGEKQAAGTRLYTVPADEFQVEFLDGDQGQQRGYSAGGAVSLMLVLNGKAILQTPAGEIEAPRGSAWLWPAALGRADIRFEEHGTRIVRARPNIRTLVESIEVVDAESEETVDFGAMLDGGAGEVRADPKSGEKIKGRVTGMDGNSVFVELGAKSEGVIDAGEFLDKDGSITIKTGDEVEAYCLEAGDRIRLTTKMTGEAADNALQEACESGIPVEGKVTDERKGGFSVQVGHQTGFCPYSQIDIGRRDAALYVGNRFSFLVTECNGRNLVLSRRRLLERERQKQIEEMKNSLSVGDIIEGEVRRVMDFGAFVDIGGCEGLVPISEFAWHHVDDPNEFVSDGDRVTVMVREIDWDRERISLSLKRAAGDPWDDIEQRYKVGQAVAGTVTRIAPFGAFVQLEAGIEGLVHISKLGAGRRVNTPAEVVDEGQGVEVTVEGIEPDRHRMSLSMERCGAGSDSGTIYEGDTVEGTIDGVQPYGVFVRLPDGRTGLLHASRMDLPQGGDREREIKRRYTQGQTIPVTIETIDDKKVGLALPKETDGADAYLANDDDGDKDGDLGSLGSILDGLNL